MSEIVWGAILRMLQSLLQGAPFIFTGLCIAGMLSRLMGHADTRRLFGSNSLSSLAQSWLIGMLLPGCSLGTIAICRQLRASGIAVGTIFAFALSSPLFDPLSLLYGLTLSKPFTIMAFAACSLAVVMVTGGIFDRLFPDTEVYVPERPAPAHGIRRMAAIAVEMARESVGVTATLVALGILGVGLLAIVLPAGALQLSMGHDNPASPLLMTTIATPAYATPMIVMSQLGSMFQHGNSVGAAFILLTLGAGVNLGLIAWMLFNYGWRKLAVWFGLIFAAVLLISYGIERPLYPMGIDPVGHTHAFDRYCAPFHPGQPPPGGCIAEIARRIRQETLPHEWFGAAALACLATGGVLLRTLDPGGRIESWLVRPHAAGRQSATWDMVIPGKVLAIIGLGSIVAASIFGCYAYYPPPEEVLPELSNANIEVAHAAITGSREHAEQWIPVSENWIRRLVVGCYLRHGRVSDYHRAKARLYENRLEELEHAIEDGDDPESLKRAALDVSRAYRFVAAAFRQERID
jgi:uncharacterized membrane protein YraQ (UPF0718 family)